MCGKALIIIVLFGLTNEQLQTRSYSCVIPSLCRDGSIIDPRILNPYSGSAVSNPSNGGGGWPQNGGGAPPSGGGAPPSGGGGGAPPNGGGGGAPPNGGGGGGNGGGGAPPSGGGGGGFGSAPSGGGGGGTSPMIGIETPGSNCPSGYIRCNLVTCGTPSTQPSSQDGVATQNAFPWQAFLINNNNLGARNGYAGGGVLLDQYHVLTAAHKVTNLTSVSVSIGVYSTANLANVQTSQIAQVWIHSSYNQNYLKNDVAILRLTSPLNINTNAMPICLPTAGRSYIGASSTSCVVSGWGQTSFNIDDAPTQVLKQVHVPIVTNDICTSSYSNVLGATNAGAYLDFPNEICAGGQNQLDACTQDGGSPLVCSDSAPTFNLVGLVLWGKDCGQTGRYGVYLNVPSYISWIQCTIQCIQGQTTCSNCPSRRII